jgi:hypothetical protein
VTWEYPPTTFQRFQYILNVYLWVKAINLNMFMLNVVSITYDDKEQMFSVRMKKK